jgi:hypothetical protein
MIAEGTLSGAVGSSILFGNVSPVVIPLGKDDGDHLTGLQRHFHNMLVWKYRSRKHRTFISHKNVQS